jgi:hypothetical protein
MHVRPRIRHELLELGEPGRIVVADELEAKGRPSAVGPSGRARSRTRLSVSHLVNDQQLILDVDRDVVAGDDQTVLRILLNRARQVLWCWVGLEVGNLLLDEDGAQRSAILSAGRTAFDRHEWPSRRLGRTLRISSNRRLVSSLAT